MAIVTDGYTLYALAKSISYVGQFSGSEGFLDLTGFLGDTFPQTAKSISYASLTSGSDGGQDFISSFGATYTPFANVANFNITRPLTTGFHTYYKMEGFNPITNLYENWHSMDAPLMIPPSGNTLTNISVVTSWIDR